MKRISTPIVRTVLVVAVGLSVFVLGRRVLFPGRAAPPDGEAAPPNVVIIVMDTTRQDRLSCYGYARDTSPRLRGLAETSTVFERAYATSSWTSPSHASLLTGLYSIAHGVTQEHWKMSEDLVTLAEVLSQHGYKTVGIVENSMLSDKHGFDQGFSIYYPTWRIDRVLGKLPFKRRSETGNTATDLFLKSVRRHRRGRPLFIFVNLLEPHSPYDSSEQFMYEYVTDHEMTLVRNMWHLHFLGRRTLTAAEIRHLNELYDAELLYTDYLIGKMIDELESSGYRDDTLFIVTADHGENFGDHEHMGHVFSLYETTIKIPLIIRYPGRFEPGSVDSRPVQLTDIFPTVLEAAGIAADAYPNQGLSLLSDRLSEDRAVFAEYYWPAQALSGFNAADRGDPRLEPFKRRLRSVITRDTKLIWGADGRHEMFDLAQDPGELVNVLDEGGDLDALQAMEQRLEEMVSGFGADQTVTPEDIRPESLDEATRDALRSLGYLQ